jgi:hypothetical protein
VAQRCCVTIPTGCWQGNCGVCEVCLYFASIHMYLHVMSVRQDLRNARAATL